MSKISDLCIRESYKDKSGTDIISWNKIGILIETNEGKQYVKLSHIPGVLISVFEQKKRENTPKPEEDEDLS